MLENLLQRERFGADIAERRDLVSLAIRKTKLSGGLVASLDRQRFRDGRICGLDEDGEDEWVKMYRQSLPAETLPTYLKSVAWFCAQQSGASTESLQKAYKLADDAVVTGSEIQKNQPIYKMLNTRARLAYLLAGRTSTDATKSNDSRKRKLLRRAMSDSLRAFEKGYSNKNFKPYFYGAETLEFAQACHLAGCSNGPELYEIPHGYQVSANNHTLRIEAKNIRRDSLLIALDHAPGQARPSALIVVCVAQGESIEIETKKTWDPAKMAWIGTIPLRACPDMPAVEVLGDPGVEALPD